jgi:transcriptional regulator with AAA-type ATPase domain
MDYRKMISHRQKENKMSDLIPAKHRDFAVVIKKLLDCNPFLPERIEYERKALGDQYVKTDMPWNVFAMEPSEDPNIELIKAKASAVLEECRSRLAEGKAKKITEQDAMVYLNLTLMHLYYQGFRDVLGDMIEQANKQGYSDRTASFYKEYYRLYDHYITPIKPWLHKAYTAEHIFAYGFQVRRAYFFIYRFIIGTSPQIRLLRARVWQSIFTHDLERYQKSLYKQMHEFITLVTGPSGSGKELVSRALAMTRYIPFNSKTGKFEDDFSQSLYAINLSAISSTLMESELFGHCKGAFTGALNDRKGYLEQCGRWGSVFLDEIGDVDLSIQVKLLRVLQTREFQRLGSTDTHQFKGKVIAATNMDLAEAIREDQFRRDLYYRLCADHIETPSLAEILESAPTEMRYLVRHIAVRLLDEDEADRLTDEVCDWLDKGLKKPHHWPGNFRELEQCVKNVLIQKSYYPHDFSETRTTAQPDFDSMTLAQIQSYFVTRLYAREQNYEQTARLLDVDSRTVRKHIDESLMKSFSEE